MRRLFGARSGLPVVVLIAVFSMFAVACGGGDDDATSTPGGAAPTGTSPTATPDGSNGSATPSQGGGNLVLGEIIVDPPVFLPSKQGTGNMQLLIFWGFFEPLMWAQQSDVPNLNFDVDKYDEGIIESWQIASDFSTVTMKVRDGVQFHGGYGEVTAHDVAWSFEDALRDGSINQRAAGIQRFVSSFEATDDKTVVMHIKDNALDPEWFHLLSNTTLGSPVIVSKKFYDEVGEEQATTKAIGTGPFEVTEWVTDDHIKAVPVANHYRKTASVESFEVRLMPLASTRVAALRTGQINVARIPLNLIQNTLGDLNGGHSQQVGPPINQTIMFAGNYWAETDENGNDIYRQREGFTPDGNHPWIGDPADAVSMDKANKVREALRISIDRQEIVDEVQSGIGKPLTNNMNAFPGDPHWLDTFATPYDVDRAKGLLAEAGYSNCFSFSLHVAPGKEWDVNVGEAVAQFWRELGCNVTVDATDYAAARPLLVNRQKNIPWMIQSGTNAQPDANHGSTMRPNAGFNLGIEVPNDITAIIERNLDLSATTLQQRIQNSIDWYTYVDQWNLVVGVSTLPTSVVMTSDILEYKPYMNDGPEFVAPETVVMR